jgi:hypothetical protein
MSEQILDNPLYCCLLKSVSDVYCVLSERSGGIVAFKTKQQALDVWEKAYDGAFNRGITGATGAMLGHMALNPSIVFFKNTTEMEEALFDKPPFNLCRLYSWNYGVECQKHVTKYWEEGIKPELIKKI